MLYLFTYKVQAVLIWMLHCFIGRQHGNADARCWHSNSVCLSVCLLRSGIASKRINISSYFLQYGSTKHIICKIRMVSPCGDQVGYINFAIFIKSAAYRPQPKCHKFFLPLKKYRPWKTIPSWNLCQQHAAAAAMDGVPCFLSLKAFPLTRNLYAKNSTAWSPSLYIGFMAL